MIKITTKLLELHADDKLLYYTIELEDGNRLVMNDTEFKELKSILEKM